MNGGLQQFARLLERIDRITAKAVEPVSVEFWLNASNREWDAEMARRYGANWKSLDDADDMTQQEWSEWKAEQEANYDC